jgi:hypothetical protein
MKISAMILSFLLMATILCGCAVVIPPSGVVGYGHDRHPGHHHHPPGFYFRPGPVIVPR